MCSRLVHLVKTPVLTIDNMMLDLLWPSSFVPSSHHWLEFCDEIRESPLLVEGI
jgi:hypothetical protein